MKGKPCIITDNVEYLELEITPVIANHYEITKWTKNMKFTLKYTELLIIKLTIITYEHIWQFVATGTP